MKKIIIALLACFLSVSTIAQDISLNDSVIFINKNPVALYAKWLSNSTPHYNMEVYSFDDYVLIKAEVIKFDAPVIELEPFYYYELTFPPTADTLSIYIDAALPLTIAKFISDYDLISQNGLRKNNLTRFINEYYGGQVFRAKIKSIEDYLDSTRHFNEQVVRDRTKPVSIIGNNIMQDGVKIGMISFLLSNRINNSLTVKNYNGSTVKNYNDPSNDLTLDNSNKDPNNPLKYYPERSNYEKNFISPPYQGFTTSPYQDVNTSTGKYIYFVNGRRVEFDRQYDKWDFEYKKNSRKKTNLASERNLYQVSKASNKNIDMNTDQLLLSICSLIENYCL